MTQKEQLWENYEDAVFAILMDAVAEQEGEKGLQLMEELEHDPSAQVPEEVQRRAEKTIRKAFAAKNREPVKRFTLKAMQRVAIAVFAAVLLAAGTFAAFQKYGLICIISSSVNMKITQNLIMQTSFQTNTHLRDFTIEPGWLPDGFTLSDEGKVDSLIYKNYENRDLANVSITKRVMSGGPLLVDSENASETKITIQQYEATLIEKEEWICLVIPMPQDNKIVYLESNGVSSDDVIKVAENLPL